MCRSSLNFRKKDNVFNIFNNYNFDCQKWSTLGAVSLPLSTCTRQKTFLKLNGAWERRNKRERDFQQSGNISSANQTRQDICKTELAFHSSTAATHKHFNTSLSWREAYAPFRWQESWQRASLTCLSLTWLLWVLELLSKAHLHFNVVFLINVFIPMITFVLTLCY